VLKVPQIISLSTESVKNHGSSWILEQSFSRVECAMKLMATELEVCNDQAHSKTLGKTGSKERRIRGRRPKQLFLPAACPINSLDRATDHCTDSIHVLGYHFDHPTISRLLTSRIRNVSQQWRCLGRLSLSRFFPAHGRGSVPPTCPPALAQVIS
jgi:hypothetical protein